MLFNFHSRSLRLSIQDIHLDVNRTVNSGIPTWTITLGSASAITNILQALPTSENLPPFFSQLKDQIPEQVMDWITKSVHITHQGIHLADWLSISSSTAFLHYSGKKDQREIVLQLQGGIQLGKSATFDGLLQLSLGQQENALLIRSGDHKPDGLSLPDLLQEGGQALGLNLPPVIPDVAVNHFECWLSLTKKSFTFSGNVQLSLTPRFNATFDLYATWKEGQTFSLNGHGELSLASASWDASTGYDPSSGWWFTLRNQHPVALGSMLEELLGKEAVAMVPADLQQLIQLSSVELALFSQPSFCFLEGTGKAQLPLFLFELALELELSLQWGEVPACVQVTGEAVPFLAATQLKLGTDLYVDLAGSYQETQGWNLAGKVDGGATIPFNVLVKDLAGKFGITPHFPSLLGVLEVYDLCLDFSTGPEQYQFSGKVDLDHLFCVSFLLSISKTAAGIPTHQFKATVTLGKQQELVLDLEFDETGETPLLVARDPAGKTISLSDAFDDVSGIKVPLPDIGAKNLSLGYDLGKVPHGLLLHADLAGGISLSGIPLIGNMSQVISKTHLTADVLLATQTFSSNEIALFNQINGTAADSFAQETVPRGFQMTVLLHLDHRVYPIGIPLAHPEQPAPGQTPSLLPPNQSGMHWFSLEKRLGPIDIQRIGLRYRGNLLTIALDASFSLKRFTLTFLGLSITSPLTHFDPSFDLMGLGLGFKSSTYQVGGTLLREVSTTPGSHHAAVDYEGQAFFKMSQLAFQGLGSYTNMSGHPSLFAYAMLNKPLGGPPYFFVTGLSLGMGYNRRVIIPGINEVSDFPLVVYAQSGSQQRNLSEVLETLQDYLPPAEGEVFMMAGLTATTFGLVNTILLLIGQFRPEMEWDLLGSSELSFPPKSPMVLAYADMPIKGSYRPDLGTARLRGVLSNNSFVLSQAVDLTGGFAFEAWQQGDHAGDFVLTLGGYDPGFNQPAYYPSLPRLQMNWSLDSHMSVQGALYMAVCGHLIMAGGHLQAAFRDGDFKASFDAGAHFLINWKPFHYEASLHVEIGVSASVDLLLTTLHFHGDVGADLNLWGPEFGGHAKVHVIHHTFKIDFGSGGSAFPAPIDWEEFYQSFLSGGEPCRIEVQNGLTGQVKGEQMMNVNPKELALKVGLMVPAKTIQAPDLPGWKFTKKDKLGIAPMNVRGENLHSELNIQLQQRQNDNWIDCGQQFHSELVTGKVPVGVWGNEFKPALNATRFVEGVCLGVIVKPKVKNDLEPTAEIDPEQMQFETTTLPAISWETQRVNAKPGTTETAALKRQLITESTNAERLLTSMGIQQKSPLTQAWLNSLEVLPTEVELVNNQ